MVLTCSFRYFFTNWDIAEVECDWKDAILEQKALLNKLCCRARVMLLHALYLYLSFIRSPSACKPAR